MPVMPKSHATPKTMPMRPKAKACPSNVMCCEGSEPRPEEPWIPTEESALQSLEERMGMMENALQQILVHLAPAATASTGPPEAFPMMPIDEEWNDPWNQ